MIQVNEYDSDSLPSKSEEKEIVEFLFKELEQYGDPKQQIQKAVDYALGRDNKPGGKILAVKGNENIVSAVVVNKTGMSQYIPENILVYIATGKEQRGKGIGKRILQEVLERTEGDVALHVEPDNPAIRLYKKLGFTNKYLEMRFNKEAE